MVVTMKADVGSGKNKSTRNHEKVHGDSPALSCMGPAVAFWMFILTT